MTTSLLQAQIAMMDFQAARFWSKGDVPEQVGNDHPYVDADWCIRRHRMASSTSRSARNNGRAFARCSGSPILPINPDYVSQDARYRHRDKLDGNSCRGIQEQIVGGMAGGAGEGEHSRGADLSIWTKCSTTRRSIISDMAVPVKHPVAG